MNQADKEKMLRYVQELGFAIDDVVLYLDTHPTDRNALEYFKHYNRMANQARQEYSTKYTPLTISCVDASECNDWQWALSPMPWEGGCH